MRHQNLRTYIETLRREGELCVIEEPIDPCLELAEIQRRVVAAQGPALLFTRVLGTEFPVATNLFGTRRRIELAFGPEPQTFIRRIVAAAETLMPPTLARLWEFRGLALPLVRTGLRRTLSGPVLDRLIQPARLSVLPQVKSWPRDGGPFLTLPLVYTEHPLTARGNLGMYRVQLYDDRTAGMHIQIHRGGGFHHSESERLKRALPANVFLGGPPALMLAAVAPLPENIPELVFASLMQAGRLRVIRDPRFSELPIPAEADFALIGRIPAGVRRPEGPFGDHYGYYSLQHDFPVFELDRICHRRDAIFPATVVGRPRQEDHYIGEYLQELFSPLFPLVMNGVRDVWAYDDAGVHPLAAAVVRERYRREAFMAALRVLGEGQLSLTKFLIVTDEPLPLRDFSRVLTHVLERAELSTDLFVFSNVAQDTLDYSSRTMNEGSKAILLGVGGKRFELAERPTAELRNTSFRKLRVFAPGVAVVEGPAWSEDGRAIRELLEEEAIRSFRLVCLVDDADDCTRDEASFVWTVFTRMEPAADIHSRATRVVRFHPQLEAPVVIDSRLKPWYPPVVEPSADTVARVDTLWPRLKIGAAGGGPI